MEKYYCKNTLKINAKYGGITEIFTENRCYKMDVSIKPHIPFYIGLVGNNGLLYYFKTKLEENYHDWYLYDWFYSTGELRQKQIDSVLNGNI